MKGKIGSVYVIADDPFVVYSQAWGIVGRYKSREAMEAHIKQGIKVPCKQWELADGQLVREGIGYQWQADKWQPVLQYKWRD